MKLQYLGTAAAEGIPSLFCQCPVCQTARKNGGKDIRSRSQAIVNDKLLIDFSCDAFYHSTRFGIDLSQLHDCIFTHVHGDHIYPREFYYMRAGYSFQPEGYTFNVYGSEDVEEKLEDQLKHTSGRLQFHKVEPFVPFEVCGMKVTALKAGHGTPHPYFYMIEDDTCALLYAHDTHMFPEETWEYLQTCGVKFDLVSLDCTGGANEELEPNYSHMYLGKNKICRAKMFELGLADENTTFVLNHFSHNGLAVNYDEFCSIVNPVGFDVSYDGKVIEKVGSKAKMKA